MERGSDGGVRKWELALLGKKQAVFPQNFTLAAAELYRRTGPHDAHEKEAEKTL